MKKIWLFILSLFTIILVWNFTQANENYEFINLDITAGILIDGTVNIKEDFTANFFVSKRWIIRDIPLNYSVWWKDFHIEVSNIDVQWRNFTTSTNNGNIEIKIWDADRTVIWKQNYPISYSTYGLIKNFSWMGYAELYWNLVGYNFDTNINKVKAELILPKIYTWFTADDFLITTDWTAKTIDGFAWTVDWSRWDKIIITYDKWLSAYHWITLAIKFPNNYFEFDHKKQKKLVWHTKSFSIKINDNIGLIAFWIMIFTRLFAVFFKRFSNTDNNGEFNLNEWKLKWQFAKDFPVIVQYNPPEWLNSAEVWLLLHRQARAKDVLSLIYKRTFEEIIQIENRRTPLSAIENTFSVKLSKIKEIPNNYPKYEIEIFDNIFTEDEIIIDEDTNLYKDLQLSNLEKYGIENWWLKKNDIWILWCFWFMFIFLSFFILPLFGWIWIIIFMVIFCSTFIIAPMLSSASQKLNETMLWAKLIAHILWYREFLATCDENKLRLFLKEDPLYFDKVLPYAIVFGLETELMIKIKPIMDEMNIKSSRYTWDFILLSDSISTISSIASHSWRPTSSSYSSDSWWDSGSSFDSGWSDFSSGWGGWWWGWSSW